MRHIELLEFCFLALLAALTVLFCGNPSWITQFLRYATLAGACVLLSWCASRTKARWAHVVHHFSPILVVVAVFDSLGDLIRAVHPTDRDCLLIEIDQALFGCDPTIWLEQYSRPWLTDLLQIAYTSYYFIPVVLCTVLYVQRRHDVFFGCVFTLVFAYFFSYLGYLAVPAIGPRFALADQHAGALISGPIGQGIADTLNALEHNKRDCFPSGHTMIVLVALVQAFQYVRRLSYIFLPFVCGLIFATIYCRYHYVIDVIAGILAAALCLWIGPLCYRKLAAVEEFERMTNDEIPNDE